MNYIKTNRTYVIIGAVIVIILCLLFWNKADAPEAGDDAIDTVANTLTNIQNASKPSGTASTQKPSSSTGNTSAPKPTNPTTQAPVPSIPTASKINGLVFKMISYNGSDIPTDSRNTISFENGSLGAKFCNSMSGNFVLDGSLLKVSNFASTMMYCGLPSNLMEIESDFVSMLNFGAVIYQSDNKLILSSPKGIVMVFEGF